MACGPKGGAAHAEAHVEGRAEDCHVDLRRVEIFRGQGDRQLEERRDAEPGPAARLTVRPEQAGRTPGIPGTVASGPEVAARSLRIPELGTERAGQRPRENVGPPPWSRAPPRRVPGRPRRCLRRSSGHSDASGSASAGEARCSRGHAVTPEDEDGPPGESSGWGAVMPQPVPESPTNAGRAPRTASHPSGGPAHSRYAAP